jgi:hypothetical protein
MNGVDIHAGEDMNGVDIQAGEYSSARLDWSKMARVLQNPTGVD